MGDFFINGVGDEVVLFGGFLLLSVIFLILVAVYQDRGRREQNARAAPREEAAERAEEVQETESTRNRTETTWNRTEPDGLRQRVVHSESHSDSTDAESEDVAEDGGASPSERGGANLEEGEDNGIKIRIVRAGLPEQPREVYVTPSSTVEELRQTYYAEELAQHRPVKFIYQGRLIGDNTITIATIGIKDGEAMHVHVGRPTAPGEAPHRAEPPPAELDLSNMFVPLVGVILGIVWVAMLSYPDMFSFMTKIFLFALSFGFVVLAYYSTRA